METWLLPLLIGVAAFFHSAVGLAGGSSYTALLAIFGIPTQQIPSISLSLNVLASTTGASQFIRNRHFDINILLPFLIGAIPSTFLTSQISLEAHYFYPILIVTLLLSASKLLFLKELNWTLQTNSMVKFAIAIIIGAVLGALAGLIGIGGGVFLIPALIIFGYASNKVAAACGVVFIWMNSVIGLFGKYLAGHLEIKFIAPFFIAAFIGALSGSYLGSTSLNTTQLNRLLGMILCLAATLLCWRWLNG